MIEETRTTRIETDVLADLIHAKLLVLGQVCLLSKRQMEHVGAGDMDSLMHVLAAKEKLLTKLQPVDQALQPFRAQDPDQRVWRSATDRQRCREEAEQCAALLSEILAVESQCEKGLAHRRDNAALQLQGAHSAGRARQAYQDAAPQRKGRFSSDA
jgi:hypothetical protein